MSTPKIRNVLVYNSSNYICLPESDMALRSKNDLFQFAAYILRRARGGPREAAVKTVLHDRVPMLMDGTAISHDEAEASLQAYTDAHLRRAQRVVKQCGHKREVVQRQMVLGLVSATLPEPVDAGLTSPTTITDLLPAVTSEQMAVIADRVDSKVRQGLRTRTFTYQGDLAVLLKINDDALVQQITRFINWQAAYRRSILHKDTSDAAHL